ncbi:T-cell surface glycoprotein CD8 alpha chain-like [Corvus moneduloides]|uniref:T-cell surface glycoprotein CD8 alpha chain-like n=1 Tax=Corvus moneduloides TaxID=1196302 RepID=UPI0013622755|nr:T-cell surface glycoprotein CD8 alpha chain-like [Corvus moneduloides]
MDRSPALLLLLTLGLCCPGIHGQSLEMKVRSPKDITQLRVGQRLELECQTDKNSGAFWIHQDKSGTLHFIVFISSVSRTTFSRDQRTSPRFEASKHNSIYLLVVKSFTPQDEGNYFCMMNFNQMLFFSPGQPAFLPVTTTVAPTTRGPIPKRGITEDSNPKTPDPDRRTQEDLDFSCHIFIWVPLAGACLLLLIALVITIVLCRRTRRRRCRCKRPANGKPPTKPRTPN